MLYFQLEFYCIFFRLQAEVEEVLEGRTEVTNEDLESLRYTEQVHSVGWCIYVRIC